MVSQTFDAGGPEKLLCLAFIAVTYVINPRRMREGMVVVLCVCVCLSVTELAATYLVCKSKVRCYKVPYDISNLCIVWI